MKLSRERKFSSVVGNIKKSISNFDLKTCLGKVKTYLTTQFCELYADEFDEEDEFLFLEEEPQPELERGIYHFEANYVEEYKLVPSAVVAGYAVIVSLGKLSKEERLQFLNKLKGELFRLGIPNYQVNEECIIVADASVEVVDFEEKKPTAPKVLYLSDYRKK